MEEIWDDFNMFDSSGRTDDVAGHLRFLMRKAQELKKDLILIKKEHELYSLHYQEGIKLSTQLQHLKNAGFRYQDNSVREKQWNQQKKSIEKFLVDKVILVRHMLLILGNNLKEVLSSVNNVQSGVLYEDLLNWKRQQQLQGNIDKVTSDLNKIQEWCEMLAEIIWFTRQLINRAQILQNKFSSEEIQEIDLFKKLELQNTQLLSSIVTSTFIIEMQPQQVIKTNTKFAASVRLLVGSKLNIFAKPLKVSAAIINEDQAKSILRSKIWENKSSGDLSDNTAFMEFDQTTKHLCAHFKNLRLKKIKRGEKKADESVTDEKFSLLFQSEFPLSEENLVFQVWTLSLPVVVVVHGSQDPHAWATVTWDNAFAKPGRIPFVVPENVSWKEVEEMLKIMFKRFTRCSLYDESLEILAEKAFGSLECNYNNMHISFSQLCKDQLPTRNFSFWEWFYSMMKLTREHLHDLWLDGHVLGFLRKKDAEAMLSSCSKGTFLLRFSDSELGGITIAWAGDKNEVFMLQPFTSKDFAVRSLPDRIFDLPHLVYLYLRIPKDEAFGKYYTPFNGNQPVNGYVKPLLVTHVPGVSAFNSSSHEDTLQMNTTEAL